MKDFEVFDDVEKIKNKSNPRGRPKHRATRRFTDVNELVYAHKPDNLHLPKC